MVLPLVDEDDPKCFLCHTRFADIEELREHQLDAHPEFSKQSIKQEPAPGDVTIF